MTIAAPTAFSGLFAGGPGDPGTPKVTVDSAGKPTDFDFYGKPGTAVLTQFQSGTGWILGRYSNGTFISPGGRPPITVGPNDAIHFVSQVPLTNLPTSGLVLYKVAAANEPSFPGGARSFDNSTTLINLGVAFGSAPKYGFDGKISGQINGAAAAEFSFTTPGGSAAPSAAAFVFPDNFQLYGNTPVTGSTANLCASDAACKFSANFIAGGSSAATFGVAWGLIDAASNNSILNGAALLTKNGATSSAPQTPAQASHTSVPASGTGLNYASYGVSAAVRESAGIVVTNFTDANSISDFKIDSRTIDGTTVGRGSNIDREHGGADSIIGWTRWSGGTDSAGTAIAVNGGGSMIWGTHATNLPTSGTASYSLLGYTQPVDAGGSLTPGTVESGKLAVDFAAMKVGFEINLTINNASYALATPGGTIAPGLALTSTGTFTTAGNMSVTGNGCGGTTCASRASGFLSGPGGAAAGVAYTFASKPGGSTNVNGTVAFTKN